MFAWIRRKYRRLKRRFTPKPKPLEATDKKLRISLRRCRRVIKHSISEPGASWYHGAMPSGAAMHSVRADRVRSSRNVVDQLIKGEADGKRKNDGRNA